MYTVNQRNRHGIYKGRSPYARTLPSKCIAGPRLLARPRRRGPAKTARAVARRESLLVDTELHLARHTSLIGVIHLTHFLHIEIRNFGSTALL